jgi:hypothetical protein
MTSAPMYGCAINCRREIHSSLHHDRNAEREGRSSQVYPPVNRCIYCGDDHSALSTEHIIPFGLNGNWELPASSCAMCAAKTSAVELICLRSHFGQLRARLDLKTRKKRLRSKEFRTPLVHANGRHEEISLPVHELPLACVGFKLPPPGIMLGLQPSDKWEDAEVVVRHANAPGEKSTLMRPDGQRIRIGRIDAFAFGRMLAKIAHSSPMPYRGVGS